MDADILEVAEIVLGIEAQMRRLDLWSRQRPPAGALASQEPFCYDTLSFGQWLQWVFIPRLTVIIERGGELPTESKILPLAEEALVRIEGNTAALLGLIARFDQIISRRATGSA